MPVQNEFDMRPKTWKLERTHQSKKSVRSQIQRNRVNQYSNLRHPFELQIECGRTVVQYVFDPADDDENQEVKSVRKNTRPAVRTTRRAARPSSETSCADVFLGTQNTAFENNSRFVIRSPLAAASAGSSGANAAYAAEHETYPRVSKQQFTLRQGVI